MFPQVSEFTAEQTKALSQSKGPNHGSSAGPGTPQLGTELGEEVCSGWEQPS